MSARAVGTRPYSNPRPELYRYKEVEALELSLSSRLILLQGSTENINSILAAQRSVQSGCARLGPCQANCVQSWPIANRYVPQLLSPHRTKCPVMNPSNMCQPWQSKVMIYVLPNRTWPMPLRENRDKSRAIRLHHVESTCDTCMISHSVYFSASVSAQK